MNKKIIYSPNRALDVDTKIALDRLNELIINSTETKSYSSELVSWFRNRWGDFVHYFTRGHEPQVWQKRTAAGDIFYRAYDPYTGRSADLVSETDLRIWLEQLPYR